MDNIEQFVQQACLLQIDEETINKCTDAIQKLAKAIVDAYQKIVELINVFWEAVRGFLKQLNPKIYNLAYHNKKHRVRKKNKKRLFLLLGGG